MDIGGLDRMVENCDWKAVRDALSAMSDDDREVAVKWYRRSGRALARRFAGQEWHQNPRVVQLLLALALAETPEEASRNCQWGRRFIWRDDEMAAACCGDILVARGRDWAAEFVRLASSATFRGESQRGVGEVVAITSAAVAAYGFESPVTETYVVGWTSLISWAHTHQKAPNREQWSPLALHTYSSGSARLAYALSDRLTLGDCLAATPSASELLAAALATPNALHEWAAFSEEGWKVEPTIRQVAVTGVVDRGPLLDHALRALSRDDRANNQRVIGELLKGLDPSADEIRERAALILHVLPTVHGSVTKALLGMALSAGLSDDDLLDLGTMILSRPEKAQKVTLVSHLSNTSGTTRQTLLGLAADSDDAALAAKARALLGAVDGSDSGPMPALSDEGLPPWSHQVESFHPNQFGPFTANEAGLDQARSDEQTWSRITTEAAFLDLAVRFAHRDLKALRMAVASWPEPNWYSNVRAPYLLHQWVTTSDPHRSYQRNSSWYRYDGAGSEPVVEQHTSTILPSAHLHFTDRLIEETMPRLGTLTELLSTPSRANGTLAATELADRVRRAKGTGYGRYDLVQALFRLGAATPSDSKLFAGLSLHPDDGGGGRSWLARRRSTSGTLDGADVIRSWIAAGGWSARQVDFPSVEPQTSGLSLPLPDWLLDLDGIAGMCAPTSTTSDQRPAWHSTVPGPWLGVCPWDVENLAATIAAQTDHDSVFHAQNLPLLVSAAGPIGPAMHHHLARLLAHPRLDSRLLAAQHAATLAKQGRLHSEQLKERSLGLFHAGDLSLARAAHGWAELAALSSLSVVWPAWRATLDASCSATKKPSGLADLLRTTREHVPVLIRASQVEGMPESLRRLASERGSSKAILEARALVGALESGAR